MPFIEHDKFKEYFFVMSLCEVRDYIMKALFISLASIHEIGIIHHDIKLSNLLYNWNKRKFKLIDFGLANKLKITSRSYGVTNPNQPKSNSTRYNECQHTAAEFAARVCAD